MQQVTKMTIDLLNITCVYTVKPLGLVNFWLKLTENIRQYL